MSGFIERICWSIFDAVEINDASAVKCFLAFGVNINGKDENGRTPLHRAVRRGHEKMAELLIINGANLDVESADWINALPSLVLKTSS